MGSNVHSTENLLADLRKYGSPELSFAATGISAATYRRRMKKSRMGDLVPEPSMIDVLPLPPDDISADEIWKRALVDSKVRMTRIDAENGWRKQVRATGKGAVKGRKKK